MPRWSAFRRVGLADTSEQAGWRHAQGASEPQQRPKLRRAFARLQAGERGTVHTGLCRESFLAQFGGQPGTPQVGGEAR